MWGFSFVFTSYLKNIFLCIFPSLLHIVWRLHREDWNQSQVKRWPASCNKQNTWNRFNNYTDKEWVVSSRWQIWDLGSAVSTGFCTLTCTACAASYEHLLSCVTTAWVCLAGSYFQPRIPHLLHSCASPGWAFLVRHLANKSHPQKASVCGPQFSPQRVDPAPSGTFQLNRTEGEAGCDANDLCVKPRLSLTHCVHAGDFTHSSFYLPHLSVLPALKDKFLYSSPTKRSKGVWGCRENKLPELVSFEEGFKRTSGLYSSPPLSWGFSLWPWCYTSWCVHVQS